MSTAETVPLDQCIADGIGKCFATEHVAGCRYSLAGKFAVVVPVDGGVYIRGFDGTGNIGFVAKTHPQYAKTWKTEAGARRWMTEWVAGTWPDAVVVAL